MELRGREARSAVSNMLRARHELTDKQPAASLCPMHPEVHAAAALSLSSLSVIGNALRLRRMQL